MIFLAEFSVIKPDFGLFFWTLLIFLLLLSLLAKFAFRPMVEALTEREKTIADSLAQADNARSEMANLKSQNEALLAQAREERTQILKEAKEMGDGIVADAKYALKMRLGKLLKARWRILIIKKEQLWRN
jgi:F-type H+-transporting ATPase subunit b